MSNGYFEHDTKLQPGTKARAEDVNARFDAVVVGFDKLPAPHQTMDGFSDPCAVGAATSPLHAAQAGDVIGGRLSYSADIGAVNAFVVNLAVPPASYAEGLLVSFKALHDNTGPSTINVNSLGAKQLVRSSGDALVAGDIKAGQVVFVVYDGTRFLGDGALSGELISAIATCNDLAENADASADLALSYKNGAEAANVSAIAAKDAAELALDEANKDSSGGIPGLTALKINFMNALGTIKSFFTNANTAARTYTFQNRDGTIADDTDLALKAPLASPTFTGAPSGPTPPPTDNSTRFATTQHLVQAFAGVASTAGYQKFKNGIVIQWGNVTSNAVAGNPTAVTFPLEFTAPYGVIACVQNGSTTTAVAWTSTLSTTGCEIRSSLTNILVRWIAIGYITPA